MRQCEILDIPYKAPSTNEIWRNANGRVYLSSQYKQFLHVASMALIGRHAPKDWKFYDVVIVVHPKRKTGDVDNPIKAMLDVLTKLNYWDDDKLVARVSSYFEEPAPPHGRTVVVVKPALSKFPFKAVQ